MSIEGPAARREILDLFIARWNADTPALNLGTPIAIRFQGVEEEQGPDQDSPYAFIAVTHVGGVQATLAGDTGSRRFESTGLVTVEVRTPLNQGGGLYLSDQLAQIAIRAYQGAATASGIWFRNVRKQEGGIPKPFFLVNVFAEFLYDEIR